MEPNYSFIEVSNEDTEGNYYSVAKNTHTTSVCETVYTVATGIISDEPDQVCICMTPSLTL